MKTYTVTIALLLISVVAFAQTNAMRIDKAVQQLMKDAQMKHGTMSLYVVETKTGNVVYHLNEQAGMTPASTQKLFTSIAAFELLGKDYRFKTELGYSGKVENGTLTGNIYVAGNGDPCLGSWRYNQTKRDSVLKKIFSIIYSAGIKKIDGDIIMDGSKFSYQPLPGGWIWEDIGNYYGAGTWAINWNENQYDLLLKPGNKAGANVEITGTEPALETYAFINRLNSGKPGSGDNGYIYMPPYAKSGFVEGTVPAGEKSFKLSGSLPNPPLQFGKEVKAYLDANNIAISGAVQTTEQLMNQQSKNTSYQQSLGIILSPTLDSLTYWFLQKSINLYGEALVKTMAYEKTGYGSTDTGVAIIKDFWSKNGIEKSALNIVDGSGLSPQNRVTTDALVKALRYAKTRGWYSSFYRALPLYNGMKMKSGTIGGAKAYAGYHTSKNGTEYTFAIIINNYDADAGSIAPKMFKMLDELK